MSSRFEKVVGVGAVERTLPARYGLDIHSDLSRSIDLCSLVLQASKTLGYRSFLVGGAVRDLLLGDLATPKDLDFTIEGSSVEVATIVKKTLGGVVTHHPRFLTAKVDAPDLGVSLDFASTRAETYAKRGALPNVTPSTLEIDLSRRDFTINALAVSLDTFIEIYSDDGNERRDILQRHVIDSTGGLEDLLQRRVRVLHAESFLDDPTRLFRACRYAVRIGGDLEGLTRVLFREALEFGAPACLSTTRVVNELRKIWYEAEALKIIELAANLKLITAACGVPESHLQGLIDVLSRVRELVTVSDTSSFIALLRILERFQGKRAPDLLEGGALKRKVIARIRHETRDRILNSDPKELEEDSLLYWAATLEERAPLIEEMRRRVGHADHSKM